MVIKKTLGYVLGGLGVIGLAVWTFPEVKDSIPQMTDLVKAIGGDTNLIIISGVLIVLGLFILIKSGGSRKKSKHYEDLPVFKGESQEVIGYRRHKG